MVTNQEDGVIIKGKIFEAPETQEVRVLHEYVTP